MIDRETFRHLDQLIAPDLSAEVRERLRAPIGPAGVPPARVPARRRTAAMIVALAVFVGAGVFLLTTFQHIGTRPGAPLDSIPGGWTKLRPAPEVLPGAAHLWTGRELISFGGSLSKASGYAPSADGYAFDPSTRTWSAIPPAPLPGRFMLAVWTGEEAVFLGVGTDPSKWQGEAFDPASRTWRVIATCPLAPRPGAVLAWTGKEMIAFGGGRRGEPENTQGAAYDPRSDSWRLITDAPMGLNAASAVWDGTEMIVFGSLLDAGNHAATRTAVGEAYDPSSDSWQAIAPSSLSPQASTAVWIDGRMVAYDYNWRAEAYYPSTDSWQNLPRLPFQSGECYPDGARVGVEVFAFGCGEVATWKPGDDYWQEVPGGLTTATVQANGGRYQLWRFATLVPAGDVLFVSAEGLTVTDSGEPCYGCPGSPSSLWAYRPAQ
jgi:hypothetical protein